MSAKQIYKDEPRPSLWSPWRRWVRLTVTVLPIALGLAVVTSSLVAAASALSSAPSSGFLAAIVGALVATLGSLLVQYFVWVMQSERARVERWRHEVAIATVLMSELGEGLVRVKTNLLILKSGKPELFDKLQEVTATSWDALKLPMSEMWAPASVFRISETYVQLRLSNDEIRRRSDRLKEADFLKAYEATLVHIAETLKTLERRILRSGRE